MSCVVILTFDQATDTKIRNMWRELREAGIPIPPQLFQNTIPPHVTLSITNRSPEAIAEDLPAIAAFAEGVPPFEIRMPYIGVFTQPAWVVFLGVTMTQQLLDVHRQCVDLLPETEGIFHGHYLPDAWVPHCTLAFRLEPEQIGETIAICNQLPMPMTAQVERIAIVDHETGAVLHEYRLGR